MNRLLEILKLVIVAVVAFIIWPAVAVTLMAGLAPWGRLPRSKVLLACCVLTLCSAAWCGAVTLCVWWARGW